MSKDARHESSRSEGDPDLLTRVFTSGRRARLAGIAIKDCPLAKGSPAAREWKSGWRSVGAETLYISPSRAEVKPDGWLVVSRRMDMDHPFPPYRYFYGYDLEPTREAADQLAREFAEGEYGAVEHVATVPCLKGMPIGAQVLP